MIDFFLPCRVIGPVLRVSGFAFATVLGFAGVSEASVAERLAGYVDGCVGMLLHGDETPFADLEQKTAKDTEASMVRVWHGIKEPELTIFVTVKIEDRLRDGDCSISYNPETPAGADMADVVALANRLANSVMDDPNAEVEMTPSSWVFKTCVGDRGIGYFYDSTVQWKGFAANVLTLSDRRMQCGE